MGSAVTLDVSKYSKDGPFNDPVVRCDSCRALLRRKEVHELGCCSACGGRRIRNVLVFSPEEKQKMIEWNIDPAFLSLFKEVNND